MGNATVGVVASEGRFLMSNATVGVVASEGRCLVYLFFAHPIYYLRTSSSLFPSHS